MIKFLGLFLLLFCTMGAGPCWIKHNPTIIPAPVVVYQPYVVYGYQYVSVVVQQQRLVPVVENRVEYRPVVGQFFMNYSHYYSYPQNYGYYYNNWNQYNY
jgi:hypothetical protein